MKIAFVSNFLNHHQLPFCLKLKELTGDNFTFVALTPVPGERLSLGYHDMNKDHSFVIRAYESEDAMNEARRVAFESDVLIVGGLHDPKANTFVAPRAAAGKISFLNCERRYKRGLLRMFSPKNLTIIRNCHNAHRKAPVYMLCASAYTAKDYALTRSYVDKTYKWGYFPKVEEYDMDALMAEKRKNTPIKIMWCARFIPLKHPETMIALAKRLKKEGYAFSIEMVGNGELLDSFRSEVVAQGLSDVIHALGSMSPEEVRERMKAANIFIFTSDFNEGWGAVLNESMNSGCAVVSSHAIGSTPFLISHEKNGLVYKNGSDDSIFSAVKHLIDDPAFCEKLGRAAYETITRTWSPEAAAERFVALTEALTAGKETPFESGPCSKAERIGQLGMYRYATK